MTCVHADPVNTCVRGPQADAGIRSDAREAERGGERQRLREVVRAAMLRLANDFAKGSGMGAGGCAEAREVAHAPSQAGTAW